MFHFCARDFLKKCIVLGWIEFWAELNWSLNFSGEGWTLNSFGLSWIINCLGKNNRVEHRIKISKVTSGIFSAFDFYNRTQRFCRVEMKWTLLILIWIELWTTQFDLWTGAGWILNVSSPENTFMAFPGLTFNMITRLHCIRYFHPWSSANWVGCPPCLYPAQMDSPGYQQKTTYSLQSVTRI